MTNSSSQSPPSHSSSMSLLSHGLEPTTPTMSLPTQMSSAGAGMGVAYSSGSSGQENMGRPNFSFSELSTNITKNKSFDNLLNILWEDQDEHGKEMLKMKLKNLNLKRKLSTDSMGEGLPMDDSVANSQSVNSQKSKLSKDNELLSKLLSQRVNNEMVVNTLSTIQPSGVPQTRIPANLANKILKVNPSNFVTSTSATEAKRPRLSSGMSTLEQALKRDSALNVSSSTSALESLAEGGNSNSALSTVSDSSISSQLGELQNLFSQNKNGSKTNLMEVSLDDNTDPLLAQILQQAQDLQHEISSGFSASSQSGISSAQSLSQDTLNALSVSLGLSNATHSVSSTNIHSMSGVNSHSNNVVNSSIDSSSQSINNAGNELLQQLELAINDTSFNLNDLDLILANSGNTSLDEQSAIDAIQQQLMSDIPGFGMNQPSIPLSQMSMSMSMSMDRGGGQSVQPRFSQSDINSGNSQLSGILSSGGILSSVNQQTAQQGLPVLGGPGSGLSQQRTQLGLMSPGGQGSFQGLLSQQGLQRGPPGAPAGFGPNGAQISPSYRAQAPRMPLQQGRVYFKSFC